MEPHILWNLLNQDERQVLAVLATDYGVAMEDRALASATSLPVDRVQAVARVLVAYGLANRGGSATNMHQWAHKATVDGLTAVRKPAPIAPKSTALQLATILARELREAEPAARAPLQDRVAYAHLRSDVAHALGFAAFPESRP